MSVSWFPFAVSCCASMPMATRQPTRLKRHPGRFPFSQSLGKASCRHDAHWEEIWPCSRSMRSEVAQSCGTGSMPLHPERLGIGAQGLVTVSNSTAVCALRQDPEEFLSFCGRL